VNACDFKDFFVGLTLLSRHQRQRVVAFLQAGSGSDNAAEVIEAAATARAGCPHCASTALYRHGKSHGLQRYRCRGCGKTFNALTGTPLARLRERSRWLDYLDCLLDTTSVRKAADMAGIDRTTSFRWRHRFLTGLGEVPPKRLNGIAEADETFLLASKKGARQLDRPARRRGGKAARRGISSEQVCILVARDRTGETVDFVTGNGPVTKQQLQRDLAPMLDHDVLLVTDGNATYRAFARGAGFTHAAVNLRAGVRTRGAVHVQNVNAYHGPSISGSAVSTGSPRVICATISLGGKCSMQEGSILPVSCSKPQSVSSIVNANSALLNDRWRRPKKRFPRRHPIPSPRLSQFRTRGIGRADGAPARDLDTRGPRKTDAGRPDSKVVAGIDTFLGKLGGGFGQRIGNINGPLIDSAMEEVGAAHRERAEAESERRKNKPVCPRSPRQAQGHAGGTRTARRHARGSADGDTRSPQTHPYGGHRGIH
jgi:transposase-like protein